VTEVHHVGISGDPTRLTGDCHQAGRACDLVGVRLTHNGVDRTLTIWNDWWGSTVPDQAHPGKRVRDWPHQADVKTEFRIANDAAAEQLLKDFWPEGTLGAIVRHATQPDRVFGLSNHHVLCHDLGRQQGDEIIQPEPVQTSTQLVRVPGDHVGTLEHWAFPETTESGVVDAAICSIDVDWLAEIADIGFSPGTTLATPTMQVTKRGRSTGRTSGWISGTNGSYAHDFAGLPPVGSPPTTKRYLKRQMQIHVDFPQSIAFGESGDSGAVVVGPGNLVVGLYWGSGAESPGDPSLFGLATPIQNVELALNISLDWPVPVIEVVDPPFAVAGETITIRGSGFLATLAVDFGGTPAGAFSVQDDGTLAVQCPDLSGGEIELRVTAPGGTSAPGRVTLGA
jgi:hypothetical protein